MIRMFSVWCSPQVSSPSCPGFSVEIPHRYPPCFSKRLSSGIFLGGDTKPTNGIKPPVIPKNTKVPTTLLSYIKVKLVNSNKGIKHFWSSTFGSFWIQNFLVDFCLFLHLWQKYNSVSSSSSRSVKLCKQSKQKPIESKMQSIN